MQSLLKLAGGVVAIALLLAACGDDTESSDTSSDASDSAALTDEQPADSNTPPPVELSRDGNTVSLTAWTYCWGAECADGAPPPTLKSLAGDGPITLAFPADFTFVASVYDEAYREQIAEAPVKMTVDGWEILPFATGPAVLEIFGKGSEGDVIVSVALR